MRVDEASPWVVDADKRSIRKIAPTESDSITSFATSTSPSKSHQFNRIFTEAEDNSEVFDAAVKPSVERCLEGRNGCFLCYGQTSSGKTHTMFGAHPSSSRGDVGVVDLAIRHIFMRLEDMSRGGASAARFRVAMSFVEVYNEKITDLLSVDTGGLATANSATAAAPSLRETADGVTYVENITFQSVTSADHGQRLVSIGNANKTFGRSYLNMRSSRAHTVLTLHGVFEPKSIKRRADVSARVFRIHFVDLAGSEILTTDFSEKQQKETISINLSLLSLRNTVCALASKEKFIPYRNSTLTRLLSSSLSSQSVTTVLCTCNPDTKDEAMTQSTLRFGDIARTVEQRAALVEFVRDKGKAQLRLKDVAAESEVRLGKRPMQISQTKSSTVTSKTVTFDTRQGKIHGCMCGVEGGLNAPLAPAQKRIGLFLHAFGNCAGDDWLPTVMTTLSQQLGFTCYGIDFPGFGATPGTRQASRTDRLGEVGGPLEIVIDVLTEIAPSKTTKVLLLGWDWGANMSLCMALSPWRSRISALILYHPSYTSPLETLAGVKVPTLLLWQPRDQLHLIATGRKMARIIAKSELVTLVDKDNAVGGESKRGDIFGVIGDVAVGWLRKQNVLGCSTTTASLKTQQQQPPQRVDVDQDGEDVQEAGDCSDGSEVSDEEDGNDLLSEHSSLLATILADPASAAQAVEAAIIKEKSRLKIQTTAQSTEKGGVAATLDMLLREDNPHQEPNAAVPIGGKRSLQLTAVNSLKGLVEVPSALQDVQAALMGRGRALALRSRALGLLGNLPRLAPYELMETFAQSGLFPPLDFPLPPATSNFATFPRFPPGRQVFATVPGIDFNMRSKTFGMLRGGGVSQAPSLRTFRCTIAKTATKKQCEIAVEAAPTQKGEAEPMVVVVQVPWGDIDAFNQPTKFPLVSNAETAPGAHVLRFEDNIVCRYHDVVTRAKLCQMALSVAPHMPSLRFSDAVDELRTPSGSVDVSQLGPVNVAHLQTQKRIVEVLRSKMDMTHHVRVGRDPDRLCVPDVGRLATYGQWHCHGMASVFAALLLPFCAVVGMEVRYRDGYWVNYAREEQSQSNANAPIVPCPSADHTWIEITFVPSLRTFVCDPSLHYDEPVLVKLEDAYSLHGQRYPTRNLEGGSVEPVAVRL